MKNKIHKEITKSNNEQWKKYTITHKKIGGGGGAWLTRATLGSATNFIYG
jgi:hypothetical protein